MLSSIFTRTLVSTKTGDHRDLALLDADKILSLKMGSLSEKSNNMKCMRMVVGLMHQNDSAG